MCFLNSIEKVDAGVSADVKALVFDSNDGDLSLVEKAQSELNSPPNLNLVDQEWHQITVTTIPIIEGMLYDGERDVVYVAIA